MDCFLPSFADLVNWILLCKVAVEAGLEHQPACYMVTETFIVPILQQQDLCSRRLQRYTLKPAVLSSVCVNAMERGVADCYIIACRHAHFQIASCQACL